MELGARHPADFGVPAEYISTDDVIILSSPVMNQEMDESGDDDLCFNLKSVLTLISKLKDSCMNGANEDNDAVPSATTDANINAETENKSDIACCLRKIFTRIKFHVEFSNSQKLRTQEYVSDIDTCIKNIIPLYKTVSHINQNDELTSTCFSILTCCLFLKYRIYRQLLELCESVSKGNRFKEVCQAILSSAVTAIRKAITSQSKTAGSQPSQKKLLKDTEIIVNIAEKVETDKCYGSLQNECSIFALCKAEFYGAAMRWNEAFVAVKAAKYQIRNSPSYQKYLSSLCFNFALDCQSQDDYVTCITWLQESLDIAQDIGNSEIEAMAYELMGDVYLKWDSNLHCHKALHAFDMTYKKNPTAQVLVKKVKCIIMGNIKDQINSTIEELLQIPSINNDLIETIVSLLITHKQTAKALEFVMLLEKNDLATSWPAFWATKIDICFSLMRVDEAEATLNKCLDFLPEHSSEWDDIAYDLMDYLINHAKQCVLNNYMCNAIKWLQYSVKIAELAPNKRENKAILALVHRYLCWCLTETKQIDEATTSLAIAVDLDPDNVMGHCLSLKLSVILEDELTAVHAIKQLITLTETLPAVMEASNSMMGKDHALPLNGHEAILYACKLAWETKNRNFAFSLLCKIVSLPPVQTRSKLHFAALQAVLHFCIEEAWNEDENKHESLLKYMNNTKECLEKMHKGGDPSAAEGVAWLIKLSWNIAVHQKASLSLRFSSFKLGSELHPLINTNNDHLTTVNHKTCLLMAISSGLQYAAKISQDEIRQKEILNHVLEMIGQFKVLSAKENYLASRCMGSMRRKPLFVVMLYEFEAKLMAQSSTLDDTFKEILQADMDTKSLETIAALSEGGGKRTMHMTVQALNAAIAKHLEAPNPDFERLIKDYRLLFGAITDHFDPKSEDMNNMLFKYATEALECIEKYQGNFPDIEIAALLTKLWNIGVKCYSEDLIDHAKQWCTMATSFANQLTTMKNVYKLKLKTRLNAMFENNARGPEP